MCGVGWFVSTLASGCYCLQVVPQDQDPGFSDQSVLMLKSSATATQTSDRENRRALKETVARRGTCWGSLQPVDMVLIGAWVHDLITAGMDGLPMRATLHVALACANFLHRRHSHLC